MRHDLRHHAVTPPQSQTAREALGKNIAVWQVEALDYSETIQEWVRRQYLALTAAEDIAMVRIIATHPWFLHYLAETPTWKEYADGLRT